MNKKTFNALLAAGAILASHSAFADASLPASFKAAIQYALENRVELKIEDANLQSAEARIDEARGAFLPSLEAFSTVQRVHAYDEFSGVDINATFNNMNIPVTVKAARSPYQASAGVELNYNLYAGGAHEARLAEARSVRRAGQAQSAVTRRTVILDVAKAYWELRKAQISQRSAERRLQQAREEANVASERFDYGRIARVELEEKALDVAVREIDLRNTSRTTQDLQRRYAYALGTAASSAPSTLHDSAAEVDIDALLASLGLMREPEVAKAHAEIDSTRAQLDRINAEYLPTLDLFVRYSGVGRGESRVDELWSGFGRDAAMIGLRFKWNLYDGYRTDSRISQARAASEQARLRAEQAVREAERTWNDSLSQVSALQDRLTLAGKQAELCRLQESIARKRWETRSTPALHYHAAQVATEEAVSKVELLQIDLLLARLQSRLTQID